MRAPATVCDKGSSKIASRSLWGCLLVGRGNNWDRATPNAMRLTYTTALGRMILPEAAQSKRMQT
eukprot:11391630-Alexandrium_andersonii.AAC.1